MRIYLAARYSRHPEMQQVRADLESLGHTVTSRWINGDHDLAGEPDVDGGSGVVDAETRERKRREWAEEDLADLQAADCCISFTEPEGNIAGRGRGGRHVEFGVALATHKLCIVVGHRENVFHSCAGVVFHETWDRARAWIWDYATVQPYEEVTA